MGSKTKAKQNLWEWEVSNGRMYPAGVQSQNEAHGEKDPEPSLDSL